MDQKKRTEILEDSWGLNWLNWSNGNINQKIQLIWTGHCNHLAERVLERYKEILTQLGYDKD